MDIADFIRARLNEDEQAASGLVNAAKMLGAKPDFYGAGGPAAEAFWARFDPARVLADVVARRRILDWANSPSLPPHESFYVLDALASVWAEHPDFRDDWEDTWSPKW
jgi:hypothetical protein